MADFESLYAAINDGAPIGSDSPGPDLVSRDRAPDGFALEGAVLGAEEGLWDRGYVVVDPSGVIESVTATRPHDVHVIRTNGIVMPGLLDLHNHPNYNVFAPWEPPTTFNNRYTWRHSAIYDRLIVEPQDTIQRAVPPQTQLRYAEIRALVSGVTAIQGASFSDAGTAETLIRTVDQNVLGDKVGAALVDLPPSLTDPKAEALKKILADISAGKVQAFYVHLAEGQHDDPVTLTEFQHLVDLGALTSATVVIHGAGLTIEQLSSLRDHGGKLIWSPQSNLRLYGQTTRAAEAMELGLPVGIGADWMPSGSHSLLAELRVARRVLRMQDYDITARQLVDIVTGTAARIAGLDGRLGELRNGCPADIVVLEQLADDPYESVLLSDQQHVQLVLIGGAVAYGRREWAEATAGSNSQSTSQEVWAWGEPMTLNTGMQSGPNGPTPAPTLSQLRSELIAAYPALGPVFG
jgi:5-methylthioadenosine/S-adenosylhomocysteine deaminase